MLTGPPDVPPTLVSTDFVDDVFGGPIYENFGDVTYTVTFSEDMDHTTITTADFDNAGTATATIVSVTETSGAGFPSVFSVVDSPSSPGTLQLQV